MLRIPYLSMLLKLQNLLPKFFIFTLLLVNATPAKAQITPDNTLGAERSVITPNTPLQSKGINADLITGGAQRDRNLFHSFSDFNVIAGQRVYFANPSDVKNILTRVTGGNQSSILGTLGVDGGANLFLINPAGILFGKNATLDLKGSFVGTTANGVQFGNLGSFSATNPQAPPLLTIDPSGLLFNQLHQGATITNQSTADAGVAPTGLSSSGLRVPDGKSLLLVGGDINIDGGRLRAYGGRVELGGLVTPGTVGLTVDGNNLSLSFPTQSNIGTVSFINAANVDVSSGGGGSISVNASDVNITGGSSLTAGTAQGLGSVSAKAGDITLNATGDIKIDGNRSFVSNNVGQQAIGNGGNITLSSNSLELTGGAYLQADTFGQGNAGNVIINATKNVSVDNAYIFSTVGSVSNDQNNLIKGSGGNIQITTDQLSLTNGSQLQASTFGQGSAGNVIINATTKVSLDNGDIFATVGDVNSNENSFAIGKSGNIQITTGELSLSNGAQLQASTYGKGNAGNVTINATKSVSLDGNSTALSSGVGASNDAHNELANGSGGTVEITTDQLQLSKGSQLRASTFGQGNAGNVIINATKRVSFDGSGTGILSTVGDFNSNQNNLAIGKSGNIQITTGELSFSDGAQLVANTYGKGNAGNITINATKSVSLDGNSTALSSGVGASNNAHNELANGSGGTVEITTDQLQLSNGAQLRANTFGQGSAGNLNIKANSFSLTSSANLQANTFGQGSAGNLNIKANSFSLTSSANLQADTFGQGNAGNVIINATKSVSLDNGNIFSTVGDVNNNRNDTIKGNGGNIEITTDQLSLTSGSQLLASTYGKGNAGNVTINATKGVSLDGNSTALISGVGAPNDAHNELALGNAGTVEITTDQLQLSNGAYLRASTYGQGSAGNLNIKANSFSLTSSANLQANTFGQGSAGNLNIKANSFSLTSGAFLQADTFGQGNAGNVIINATKSVSLDNGSIFDTVGSFNNSRNDTIKGNGGNIEITTDQLSLTNGSQLLASTYAKGNAGNVTINAIKSVSLDGSTTRIDSNVGDVNSNQNNLAIGNSGSIQITTSELSFSNGAQLVASTFGQGNAGNVIINATKNISLNGKNTAIFSAVGDVKSNYNNFAIGNSGNIRITTGEFFLSNGAQLLASTYGKGNAGNVTINATKSVSLDGNNTAITSGVGATNDDHNNVANGNGGSIEITTNQLQLSNGAQVRANTYGQGSAGNLHIKANSLSLASGAFLQANTFSSGNAGSIIIDPPEVIIRDGANISVNSYSTGNAGNIILQAGKLTLDNKAFISAQTTSSNGGNIILNLSDYLLLRNGSKISTNAGTAPTGQARGNGGNITINTPFIIAVPNENSDITANASRGNGGNIDIHAQLFGIEARSKSSDQDQTNVITASSDLGIQGQINISQPEIELIPGLIELPIQVSDAATKFSQLCPNSPNAKPLGEFVITGKGNIPPNPLQLLPGRNPDIPLATAEDMQEIRAIQAQDQKKKEEQQHNTKVGRKKNKDNTLPSIVEAQGIVQTPDGQIYFVANANHATPSSQPTASPCPSHN